jgi:hypothetical protein
MQSLHFLVLVLLAYTYPLLRLTLSTRIAMSQKALLLHEVGKSLIAGNRPIPQPRRDQLLVKVLVAGSKLTSKSTNEDERIMLNGFQ